MLRLPNILTVLLTACNACALPAGIISNRWKELSDRNDLVSSGFRNIAYWSYLVTDSGTPYPILPQTIQNPSHITHLYIFSIDLHSSSPNLTVAGFAPDDTTHLGSLWSEVSQIQSTGIKVLATLGAYHATCWLLLQDNFNAYYPTLLTFLKKYTFDGIDLDIEPDANGNTPDIDTPLKLITSLRNDMGANFIISMAPVAADLTANPPNYSGFSYKQLDQMATSSSGTKYITYFAGQFYNGWGDCGDTATYDEIISNGYSASRVVFGVASNQQDGNDWCDIQTVTSVTKQLLKKYPTMAGVDEYEIQRAGSNDNLQPWQWHQAIYNATH